MFIESAIRHPEADVVVVRRHWQVKAIEKMAPDWSAAKVHHCSELLCMFELHFNNRSAHKLLCDEMKVIYRGDPRIKRHILHTGDWLPYTRSYILETLGSSVMSFRDEITLLEKVKFISTDVPEDIGKTLFAHNQRFTWIRLNVPYINEWIEKHARNITGKILVPDAITAVTDTLKDDTLADLIDSLCEFHRHIMGKRANYLYDVKRKKLVRNILKERKSAKNKKTKDYIFSHDEVMGQCAQAILGHRLSDFHDGANTSGKVYDDISLTFRSMEKFDNFIGYAVEKGVTETIAYRHFINFIAGEGSRYAKRSDKPSSGPKSNKEYESLPPQIRVKYITFARTIAAFFKTNTPLMDIMEYVRTTEQIKINFPAGTITNVEALTAAIKLQFAVFKKGEEDDNINDQIQKFAMAFCQLQRINT